MSDNLLCLSHALAGGTILAEPLPTKTTDIAQHIVELTERLFGKANLIYAALNMPADGSSPEEKWETLGTLVRRTPPSVWQQPGLEGAPSAYRFPATLIPINPCLRYHPRPWRAYPSWHRQRLTSCRCHYEMNRYSFAPPAMVAENSLRTNQPANQHFC